MSTLILSRADIAALMAPADYLGAVEDAFRAGREGRAGTPAPMEMRAAHGVFHAKGGLYRRGRACAVLKLNGNFPDNPARNGLPTIQGALLLCDADNGALLAIMDSGEVTLRRTAAASALAARLLARADARSVLVCGAGVQGRAHVEALTSALTIERVLVWDSDSEKAEALARHCATLGFEAAAAADLAEAGRASAIIATCTTAHEAFLSIAHVAPGAFVAAVGADNPHKSEIGPSLMAAAAVVTDSTAQCAAMGDLRAAIAVGALAASDVRAELNQIVVGEKPGRRDDAEIIVFDSTGLGVQDAASAALIYERALAAGRGLAVELAA